jgi:NHLM bacteriocin system ABC transporter peptidase/ATP-binding protein
VLQLLLRALQLRYLRELRAKLAVKLSGAFVWHVVRLPINFFSQRFAGEISSRVALNQAIADSFSGQIATAVIDACMLAFYLAVMAAYDLGLTLIGASLAVGNVLALRFIAKRRMEANLRLGQEQGKLSGVSIAGLQGVETLKASALESAFFGRWAGHYARVLSAGQELGASSQTLGVVPGLLAALTTLSILIVGGLKVIDGQLSVGGLVAFQSLMTIFQGPVATLVALAGRLQTLAGDVARVDDVLQHEPDVECVEESGARSEVEEWPAFCGRLELRGVTFGYNRSVQPLIESLDLCLEPGQRVAIVGGSGSGKSTVARLVCGLYQPWAGEILIDGVPRRSIPRGILARGLALVDQDVQFFAGTVRENLTLWDPTVPHDFLLRACRDAEIHDTVLGLNGGYDADLLEGASNLSGGQRQRLELARALVQSPAILVLDEATSALDAETEFRIDRNLRRRGCSTLIVAHRLSTIRDADEIIVLSRGRVVQRGRHEVLWRTEGDYRLLVQGEGGDP